MLRTVYTLSKNKSVGLTNCTMVFEDHQNGVKIELTKRESLELVRAMCKHIGHPVGSPPLDKEKKE